MILPRFWRRAAVGTTALLLGTTTLDLLAGEPSPAAPRTNDKVKPPQSAPAPSFRAQTDRALSASFPPTPVARKAQAEKLVSLYKQIGQAKEVVPAERTRLQGRLKSRLARLASSIALDVKQARAAGQSRAGNPSSTADQPLGNRSSTGADTPAEADTPSVSQAASVGPNGGAPQDDGQALVELIQATIAPQSWDVNGGPGSIVYWPAWHVLVVRQTDDVHEQIGGVMHGMRK